MKLTKNLLAPRCYVPFWRRKGILAEETVRACKGQIPDSARLMDCHVSSEADLRFMLWAVVLIVLFTLCSCAPSRAFYSATPGVTEGGPYYRGIPGGNDIGGNGFPTYDYDFPIRGPRR